MTLKPKRSKQKRKSVTLYHGTEVSAIPKIKKTKKIIGHWTKDPDFALAYTTAEQPVAIVAEVPVNIIAYNAENYLEVYGFHIKKRGKTTNTKKSYKIREETKYGSNELPIKYVKYLLYAKIGEDVFTKGFDKKQWVEMRL